MPAGETKFVTFCQIRCFQDRKFIKGNLFVLDENYFLFKLFYPKLVSHNLNEKYFNLNPLFRKCAWVSKSILIINAVCKMIPNKV